jgi:glucuronate isomerase
MNEYRYFTPEHRDLALELYIPIAKLPLICPHGHVDPRVFSDPDYQFGSPAELLIIPDHYIFRMLYSQGIALERLGIPTQDETPVESDQRKIWQLFADHFYLFRGTPTGIWLRDELESVFGIEEKLNSESAQRIYDQIAEKLTQPEFRPRALYERFNIEVLATTDAATDTLEHHRAIQESEWQGRIIPTFRPDGVVNLDAPNWRGNIDRLSEVSGIDVHNFQSFLDALYNRREYFKSMGATATDHAAIYAHASMTPDTIVERTLQNALKGTLDLKDHGWQIEGWQFTARALMEMARMSIEDGLVMQLHVGSSRNHNHAIFQRFGLDKGADIPRQTEFTQSLQPLLSLYGNDPRLTLILFTLDESTYSRELAPLAGHYPALKLGPPWWFHDSLNGMRRFFDNVMETAGIYNTAGFNDDTRAFLSIPSRHDVWRRACADWLAGLVSRHIIDLEDAHEMAYEMAYGLAKKAYKLRVLSYKF